VLKTEAKISTLIRYLFKCSGARLCGWWCRFTSLPSRHISDKPLQCTCTSYCCTCNRAASV